MMRKYRSILIGWLSIVLGLFTSCHDTAPLVYEISIDQDVIEFSFESMTRQVSLKSNYKWSISNYPDWISISPTSGDRGQYLVTISCTANKATEERNTNLKINLGDVTKQLAIRQMAQGFLLFDNRDTLLHETAHNLVVSVTTKLDYELSIPDTCLWITATKKNKTTYIVEVSSLSQDIFRKAPIIIKTTQYSLSDTIIISQTTQNLHNRILLEKLYHSTNGDQWRNKTNWLSDKPLNEWNGIQTVGNKVIYLHLAENNLTGNIPSELYDLENLEDLNLSDNFLSGIISPNIRKLKNIRQLALYSNNLSGDVPDELWGLPHLGFLNLSDNPLDPVTINYKKLSNIVHLVLNRLYLTNGLSPEIGLLTNIVDLSLEGCHLTGILPNEFFTLKKLDYLYLLNNSIQGPIPAEIGKLTNLSHLSLTNNNFTGTIPEEMGKLIRLRELSLSDNHLSGKIPSSLIHLPNWQLFDLNFILPQKDGGMLEIE